MYKTKAYSAASATTPLAHTTIPRREPTPRDVQIEILYCGICHSDLHYARNEWSSLMQTVYPCVPGHEIVGRVTKVGSAVTGFKAGEPFLAKRILMLLATSAALANFKLTCNVLSPASGGRSN